MKYLYHLGLLRNCVVVIAKHVFIVSGCFAVCNGFAVICFAMAILSIPDDSYKTYTHILKGCLQTQGQSYNPFYHDVKWGMCSVILQAIAPPTMRQVVYLIVHFIPVRIQQIWINVWAVSWAQSEVGFGYVFMVLMWKKSMAAFMITWR